VIVLGYISEQKLITANDAGSSRLRSTRPARCQEKGDSFFLLGNENTEKGYCKVDAVYTHFDPDSGKPVDINLIDADGMLSDESAYISSLSGEIPTASYTPLLRKHDDRRSFSIFLPQH